MQSAELRQQIEAEIDETERRLQFWRGQGHLQTDTALGPYIQSIVDGYDRQLENLEEARKLFDA